MVPASVAATIHPYKRVLIPCGAQSHRVFFLLHHTYIDVIQYIEHIYILYISVTGYIYIFTYTNIFLYVKKETHVLYTFLSKHAGNPTSPEALTFATVEW